MSLPPQIQDSHTEWNGSVNPEIYLADVLKRIPTHPNKRIKELVPYEQTKGTAQRTTCCNGCLIGI